MSETKHKVFISYHHDNDQWYKNELLRLNELQKEEVERLEQLHEFKKKYTMCLYRKKVDKVDTGFPKFGKGISNYKTSVYDIFTTMLVM